MNFGRKVVKNFVANAKISCSYKLLIKRQVQILTICSVLPFFVNERSFIMKENRKEHLLQVAMQLFAQRGYDATPISLIARTAGVSQGLLYNYFESKTALLQAIFERSFEQIQQSMQGYANAQLTPIDALQMHLESTFAIVKQQSNFWRLFHQLRLQGDVLADVAPMLPAFVGFVETQLTQLFTQLQMPQPHQRAQLLFALIDGLTARYLLDNQAIDFELLIPIILKQFTNN